jgi:hypothetical protein
MPFWTTCRGTIRRASRCAAWRQRLSRTVRGLVAAWTPTLRWPRSCMPRRWSLDTGRPRTTWACTGRDTGVRVLPVTSSPMAQKRQRPISVAVRTQNAPPVWTLCGPARGKPRQQRALTQRQANSERLLSRSLKQSQLPAWPRHSLSRAPFRRQPIFSPVPSSLPPFLSRASSRRLSACS